ncbi:MAG: DNA double-strand break repair nuclease NurA [Gloeomargarita sp. SKYG98]|nr:DNA double-strand break repair nuclease NurA [Gloeomargarita sp. SKYG98]
MELGLLASAESEILTIFDYSWSGLPRRELGIRRDWRDYGVRDQFWGVWGDLIDETFGERMEGASRERVVAIPKASSSRVVVEEFCRFVRRRCSGGTEWIERVELFTDVSLLGFLLEPGEYLAPMRVDLGRFDGYYGRELWCVYVYPRCGERVLRVEFFSGLDWFWALGVIDAQCVAGCREPLVQALVDREAKQRVGIVVREGEMRRELLVRRAGSALQARAYLQIFGAYRS